MSKSNDQFHEAYHPPSVSAGEEDSQPGFIAPLSWIQGFKLAVMPVVLVGLGWLIFPKSGNYERFALQYVLFFWPMILAGAVAAFCRTRICRNLVFFLFLTYAAVFCMLYGRFFSPPQAFSGLWLLVLSYYGGPILAFLSAGLFFLDWNIKRSVPRNKLGR